MGTIIYGDVNGWKELILKDLKQQCSPLLFIPEILGSNISRKLIDEAFDVYKLYWERGEKNCREKTENYFANTSLSQESAYLLDELEKLLNTSGTFKINIQDNSQNLNANNRYPSKAFNSRYRQPLGILSVFDEKEISAWHCHQKITDTDECLNFIKKALFLDLGSLKQEVSLTKKSLNFELRKPIKNKGDNIVYAPELPDMSTWLRLKPKVVKTILDKHREKTNNPSSVFKGGAFDQCSGNVEKIAEELCNKLPNLIFALREENFDRAFQLLLKAKLITAPKWHPAYQSAYMCPLWAFSVCALAISVNNRKIRSHFNARRNDTPSSTEVEQLIQKLIEDKNALDILDDCVLFLQKINNFHLKELLDIDRPRVLSLDLCLTHKC